MSESNVMWRILAGLIFGFIAMNGLAQQQKAPAFDPLNPPKPTDEAARSSQAQSSTDAPIETMVVTPETAAPALADENAKDAAATTSPAPVATGPKVVAYDELESQVGKQIQIRTNLRTQRSGILKRFNRAVLVIEDRSRGFAMDVEIPRQTVVEVSVAN